MQGLAHEPRWHHHLWLIKESWVWMPLVPFRHQKCSQLIAHLFTCSMLKQILNLSPNLSPRASFYNTTNVSLSVSISHTQGLPQTEKEMWHPLTVVQLPAESKALLMQLTICFSSWERGLHSVFQKYRVGMCHLPNPGGLRFQICSQKQSWLSEYTSLMSAYSHGFE
jgi:hypothetical protein